ncbi:MAG: hypothetical protein KBS75_05330 [Bacteroidales bacterium]|nr:hypothetical protein [Candidatus Equimonas faecalis]
MKKILFMLTAMAAFLLASCSEGTTNNEEETHSTGQVDAWDLVFLPDTHILPGHEGDSAVGDFQAELGGLYNYGGNNLTQNEINIKARQLQIAVTDVVSKYDNGYLYGTITIKQVESNGPETKTIATYELKLQKEAYKYEYSFKGMSKRKLQEAIDDAIKTLDGKENLTDKEVAAAFNGIYNADAYPYVCGNFDVSKTTDGGKTFSAVSEASIVIPQKSKFYYVMPNVSTSDYFNCYKKLIDNMLKEMRSAVAKCDNDNDAIAVFNECAEKYQNRFTGQTIKLLADKEAFDTGISNNSNSIHSIRMQAHDPLYGWTIDSRDNDLYKALIAAQFDIESQGLCYGDTPDKFIEFIKDICRQFPDYSGSITIQSSTNGGRTTENIETFYLPLK